MSDVQERARRGYCLVCWPEDHCPHRSKEGEYCERCQPTDHCEHAGGARPSDKPKLAYIDACARDAWSLLVWPRGDGDAPDGPENTAPTLRVFRCRSWRHPGACRRWRAAQNFARLLSGQLAGAPPGAVVYLVLTFYAADCRDRWTAFRRIMRCWQSLRQGALERRYGKLAYALVVEAHRSGQPHCNVVILNAALAAFVGAPRAPRRAEGQDTRPGSQRCEREAYDWFVARAKAAGFGHMLTVERADSTDAVAGYCVKLAADVDAAAAIDERTAAEAVKHSQVPDAAPRHFRRIRASRGFLARPLKNETVTGTLIRMSPKLLAHLSLGVASDGTFYDLHTGEVVFLPRLRPTTTKESAA